MQSSVPEKLSGNKSPTGKWKSGMGEQERSSALMSALDRVGEKGKKEGTSLPTPLSNEVAKGECGISFAP